MSKVNRPPALPLGRPKYRNKRRRPRVHGTLEHVIGRVPMGRIDTTDEVRSASHDLADRAVDAGLRAVDSLDRAVSSAQDTSQRLAAQTSELSDNLQKVAKNFSNAIDKSVAEQPMTTLGMAVAAGFILGAIWKS